MQAQVDSMTKDQAKLLRNYNRWRRGADIEMPKTADIGKAIDAVCDHILGAIKCPFCGSEETELFWVQPETMPEYQHGECFTCEEHWNECAREEVE